MAWYGDLSGRAAIITGAASGIGRATAVALAEAGTSVVIGAFFGDPHDPDQTLKEVRGVGGSGLIVEVDVRRTDSVEAFAEAALSRFGRLDFAVANAGILRRHSLTEIDDAAWQQTLEVDLTGVLRTLRAAARRIAGRGAMVAISSIAGGVYGWGEHVHYASAKAGVVGLVRSVAVELAPRGIRANAIIPGIVESPQSADPVNSLGPEGLKAAASAIPLGRVGQPSEIASVARFLLSEQAAFLTGQALTVDGGQTVWMQG
jgi:3-oxoacyl-[acyl-carrier protein] reductase